MTEKVIVDTDIAMVEAQVPASLLEERRALVRETKVALGSHLDMTPGAYVERFIAYERARLRKRASATPKPETPNPTK